MTEKLYYKDAYTKSFTATVLSCEPFGELYDITLDRTAFFPEEGGQTSDGGRLGDASVSYVYERDGVIRHRIDRPLAIGETVVGEIDFAERFSKMQIHTAEHILSGFFHKEYGLSNVGFHLGEGEVTMDTSSPVTKDMAYRVERLANEAVYKNLPVSSKIFDAKEAENIPYRSKLEFKDSVRLVEILGVDICACCAPHVRTTGEIGIIKIIRIESHKGGSRIYMLAGRRAYEYISSLHDAVSSASALLSAPPLSVADEVKKLLDTKAALEGSLVDWQKAYAEARVNSLLNTDGNLTLLFPAVGREVLRECAKLMKGKCKGLAVALAEGVKGYSFVMAGCGDISAECKKATAALQGKGGGRGDIAEGSFSSSLDGIFKYFGD